MAVHPTPAVCVVPVLALCQARIARTHRALLSTVFVLGHRHRYTEPWEALPAFHPGRPRPAVMRAPLAAALAQRVLPARPVHPRPPADLLWVERLATGAILGTHLDLHCRDDALVRAAVGDTVIDVEA